MITSNELSQDIHKQYYDFIKISGYEDTIETQNTFFTGLMIYSDLVQQAKNTHNLKYFLSMVKGIDKQLQKYFDNRIGCILYEAKNINAHSLESFEKYMSSNFGVECLVQKMDKKTFSVRFFIQKKYTPIFDQLIICLPNINKV